MGDLFEHLIYKFAEASNEEAGEHYTPRDAIRLMVDLLFAEDNAALLEPGTVRTIYDPPAPAACCPSPRNGCWNATLMRGCGCTGRRSTTSRMRSASPT